jgi:hypothetical protein
MFKFKKIDIFWTNLELRLTNLGRYFDRYFHKPDFSLPTGIFSQTGKNNQRRHILGLFISGHGAGGLHVTAGPYRRRPAISPCLWTDERRHILGLLVFFALCWARLCCCPSDVVFAYY